MRRRDFVLAAAMLVPALSMARAQQSATAKRLAVANPSTKVTDADPTTPVFFEKLQRLGYVEGKNLIVDRYSAEGHRDRYGAVAREIVDTNPDVIWSIGSPMTREFKALTSTIPIVAFTGDPVRFGLVPSLAHPGGNITGVSSDAGLEIWGKRLELLAEAIPTLRNVVFVGSPGAWENPAGKGVQEVGRKLGIAVVNTPLGDTKDEAEYRRAFGTIRRDQVDAILIADEVENYTNRFLIVKLVQQLGLPAIFGLRDQTEAGGLMSYSFDLKDAVRTIAAQIAEILRGAKPGDIPYEQAVRFELVINLKTAKALGLDIPAAFIARADALIE
jgi:putative ABC transport system substrate-binding protein